MLNIKTSLRSSVFAGAFVMALAASAAQAAPVQFNFRYVNTVSTVTGSFMSDLFAPGQYALSSISGTVNSTIDGNGSITNLVITHPLL